jgi:hypothetical protein
VTAPSGPLIDPGTKTVCERDVAGVDAMLASEPHDGTTNNSTAAVRDKSAWSAKRTSTW